MVAYTVTVVLTTIVDLVTAALVHTLAGLARVTVGTLRCAVAAELGVGVRVDTLAVAKRQPGAALAGASDTHLAVLATVVWCTAVVGIVLKINAVSVDLCQASGTSTHTCVACPKPVVAVVAALTTVVEGCGEVYAGSAARGEPRRAGTDARLAELTTPAIVATSAAVVDVGCGVDARALARDFAGCAHDCDTRSSLTGLIVLAALAACTAVCPVARYVRASVVLSTAHLTRGAVANARRADLTRVTVISTSAAVGLVRRWVDTSSVAGNLSGRTHQDLACARDAVFVDGTPVAASTAVVEICRRVDAITSALKGALRAHTVP